MEKKKVSPATKKEAQSYAEILLEDKLSCKVKSIKYLGGGSFGYAYKAVIDKAPYCVIMKACRADGMCAREAEELKILGADSLIKIPKVYFTSFADEKIPVDYICMEYIEGTNCYTDFFKLLNSKKAKERFADRITDAAYHWHCQTNEKFGLIGNAVFDEWLDFYKPFALEILECARTLELENEVIETMERAWEKFDYIFSEKVEKPSLIHGDLNVMNILSDKKLTSLAIIDPLESKWADREYDLFQFNNLTGRKFGLYEKYKEKFPVSEKCDLKTAFYALYHEIYCYIISGNKINSILMPLVKNMNKELDKI